MDRSRFRGVELVRAGWGAALLVAPATMLRDVNHVPVDRPGLIVARILGARQLAQATLSGFAPSPEVLAMGVWVDAVHALSALGLAVVDPSRARAGLTDTAVAATWAALGRRDLATGRVPPPAHDRRRDALARAVLGVLPGGRRLRHAADDARERSRPTDRRLAGA